MIAVRVSALLFATGFAVIIYLANTGQGGRYWSFLDSIPFGDKLGHIGLLGAFSLILNLALRCRRCGPFLLGSCLLLIGMLIEEASQQFLAHRSFDLLDMVANVAGIFIGAALASFFFRRFPQTASPATVSTKSNKVSIPKR
jgi:glycopeptide antibiotics resistance protein